MGEEPEILTSTYKISGKEGEGIFIKALEDKDVNVRRKAVYYLGLTKCTDTNVISHLIDLIRKRRKDEEEPPDHLQMQAIASLGLISTQSKECRNATVKALIHMLTPGHRGLFNRGKTDMREKSETVMIVACKKLALLGSKDALPVFKALRRANSEDLNKASEEAIQKIESAKPPHV